ncbi:MAG: S-layer homology domain-containing protein, partial [Clostridiales Family XIII bacterium]|nr:S-layer homology domain-containing protein [Clostridiales Family XIII bacterium]
MKRKITSWIAVLALFAAGLGAGPATPAFAAVSFSDIADHWAAGEIGAAVNYGYINGYEDGTFKPENPISRAEFVKI